MSRAKTKKLKQYGYKPDAPKKENYVFGSILSPVPFEEINPSGDWTADLPIPELQNKGFETWSCVTHTVLNCVEILIKKKYGLDRNYSERFLAAVSGTEEGGNTPNQVCEFLRKIGVVPEELLPFGPDINTFEKFYAPISPKLYELAREFLAEWDFKYEDVPDDNEAILKALKCSPLGLAVTAWFERGSKYYKPEGMSDNHFTTLIKAESGNYKRVFDSYADGEGDPFLKDIDWETPSSAIKRFYIKKKDTQKKTFWQKLMELLSKLW